IKTIDDFKNQIREDLAKNLSYSSDHKFALDLRTKMVEENNLEIPGAFLKRWLIASNEELTEEQVENEFGLFIDDLKWQLIVGNIVKNNELKVTSEEISDFGRQMARAQFNQYGMYDIPEEQLESFAKMILDKPEERERIYKKIQEDKVV